MNKTHWIMIIVAVIFAGGGFYGGTKYEAGQVPASTGRFAGAGGNFTGGTFAARGGAGGATFGTILSISPTSITIQLPTSTSTSAASGTKIVLYDSSTQIQALQSVPASNLSVGQNVTVAGTANADGSVTATSIQVRPAGGGRPNGTAPTSGQ